MRIKWIGSVLGIGALLLILFECCQPGESSPVKENSYTGSASCQSCHAKEHTDWLGSHHYMAMQPANDSTVFGDFNNAVFTADGVSNRFFKKDGKFYINTEDETGINRDMEILFTFGVEPLQQYLVAFPGGKMQATRASWDTKAQKWFHQYPGQKLPHGDWLHWTGNGQNWNTMCASCHSTNVKKGYDTETDIYKTTYNEINVSCESCHGPGKNHIDYVQGSKYKNGDKVDGSFLLLHPAANRMNEINTCGYCHARRADITENIHPGEEVLNDYIPELPTTPFFYADGQMDDEDYNYSSFLQSKMYQRGVQCTHCHNPHSGKLKLDGPTVCGQCHSQEQYQSEAHTLHKVGTVGVNCISCHMPSKLYMGNDLRHDHSFRIPRPDLTQKHGVPNTCNACHNDQTAKWAMEAIEKGYGKKPDFHWSELLVTGGNSATANPSQLMQLTGDSSVPNIARAAALRYLGQLAAETTIPGILKHLQDSSALVRHTALNALRNFPAQNWLQNAAPLFSDNVLAVRIAAANLYLDIPQQQIPSQHFTAFTNAKNQLLQYTLFQTDFAQGNLLAGDYYSRTQDPNRAVFFYNRAIEKDSQLVNARVNLASILNQLGKNEEALHQLIISSKIQPESDHILFTKGLLYAEMQEWAKAEEALKRAGEINPNNVRALYNYGLLLANRQKITQAEAIYKKALQADPTDGDVLNALTILYLQNNQTQKALEIAKNLKKYHGSNPAYAGLLRQIGM